MAAAESALGGLLTQNRRPSPGSPAPEYILYKKKQKQNKYVCTWEERTCTFPQTLIRVRDSPAHAPASLQPAVLRWQGVGGQELPDGASGEWTSQVQDQPAGAPETRQANKNRKPGGEGGACEAYLLAGIQHLRGGRRSPLGPAQSTRAPRGGPGPAEPAGGAP